MEEDSLKPGAIFGGDFRIIRLLGEGGMGAVFVAEQLSTGKQRALKVLARELTHDQTTLDRFVLEARVGARIDSDHVVEVITAGVDESTRRPFLVMELLKGESLDAIIERSAPLPLGDVAEIFDQLGHALERAHAQGIVHRDLKPENLFIATSRRKNVPFTLKILDFGIAKMVEESRGKQTQPLGTPLFMSPEQCDHEGQISPATDVWSLGLIAFILLTGKYFWRESDSSIQVVLRAILFNPIPAPSERAKELGLSGVLPAGFDAWFARCVTRDAKARFAEAGAAARAFAALVPAEAPRGRLVMITGPAASARDPDIELAATLVPAASGPKLASTPAEMSRTPPPATRSDATTRSGAMKWIVGAAAVAATAGALWFVMRSRSAPPDDAATPHAPSATSSSSAPAPVAHHGPCPPGMRFIEGGKMYMGSKDAGEASKPPHKVMVAAFCLDIYEVTTGAYQACTNSGSCQRASQDVEYRDITPAERKIFSLLCNARRPGQERHPVNCVDWAMSDNYCRTVSGRLLDGGARLPTEAEWEYAARGPSQRTFPWGDEPPDQTRLNACGTECTRWGLDNAMKMKPMYEADDGWPATAPVGSFKAGASAAGIMDLAGNVWEWTSDWYAPYTAGDETNPAGPREGTERVVRGGGFNGWMVDWAKPSYRWKAKPETYNHAIGFRCAKEPAR